MGTVWSSRPSPICLSSAHSVTLPPVPGLGSSASKSIFSVTSPVGIGSLETCLYVSTPRNEYVWCSRPVLVDPQRDSRR